MHIIIDGYNVLKQLLGSGEISLSQRRAFINMLGKYAQKKNHDICVIFDGGPDVWPSQEIDHGITVVYSGIKQSADDLIKVAMQKKSHGLLIVSSDNELKMAAAKRNITSIDALEFYSLVRHEMQSKPGKTQSGLVKTSTEENALLDSLCAPIRNR